MNRYWVRSIALAAISVLVALAAYSALGGPFAWAAPGRAAANALEGEGIALLQFLLMAALTDQLMWALASRGPGALAATRVPRLALQIVTLLIYTLFLCLAINRVFEQSMTTILGASGLIGLILGFGLRALVADVFSGIALHLDAAISIGDWVDLQYRGRDVSGRIVDFAWRTVLLADRADNIVLIPNGEFAAVMVINRSRPSASSQMEAVLELSAEHDETRVLAVLRTALNRAALDGVLAMAPAPRAQLAALKDGVLTFRMLYNVEVGATSPGSIRHAVLAYAVRFLKAAGIPVGRTVHTEWRRHGGPGQHHLDQPQARIGVLGSARFLSMLAPADLAIIAAEAVVAHMPSGNTMLAAGAPGNSMFVLSEGSLDVIIDGPQGPLTVARLWPGDCVGEMSLFTGEPRSAEVRTREASVTFEVGKDTMAGIFARNPALMDRVATLIEERRNANGAALQRPAGTPAPAAESPRMLERIREFFRAGAA